MSQHYPLMSRQGCHPGFWAGMSSSACYILQRYIFSSATCTCSFIHVVTLICCVPSRQRCRREGKAKEGADVDPVVWLPLPGRAHRMPLPLPQHGPQPKKPKQKDEFYWEDTTFHSLSPPLPSLRESSGGPTSHQVRGRPTLL